jgi:HK97 family phage prohead protease
MEDAKKREIRTIDCQLAIREAAEGQESESRTITGRAIVFNAESEVLDDWGERFREVILPEAVTMEFLNTQDVKLNMLHERELTLARCNKGAANASLRMAVDEQGVTFEFEAPRCDIGDRCLEMVRRGDYSGCSFEFFPKDYEVERTKGADGKDEVIIRHKSFEFLSALTIGMDPAYRQTSVNARELDKQTPEGKAEIEAAETAKREAEQKALDEAAARHRELQMMRMRIIK